MKKAYKELKKYQTNKQKFEPRAIYEYQIIKHIMLQKISWETRNVWVKNFFKATCKYELWKIGKKEIYLFYVCSAHLYVKQNHILK